MITIRGAITVSGDLKDDILESTKILLMAIMEQNQLTNEQIISIYFTATKDLTKVYPAVAARNIGLTECSLICSQEMYVENSLEKCIRVLVHVESEKTQKEVQHVFLREAKKLRPDIADKKVQP